jgi:hypothetical protein
MHILASLLCSQSTTGVDSVMLDENSTGSIEQDVVKLCVPSTVAHMPQTTIQLLQVSCHSYMNTCIHVKSSMRACVLLHVPVH